MKAFAVGVWLLVALQAQGAWAQAAEVKRDVTVTTEEKDGSGKTIAKKTESSEKTVKQEGLLDAFKWGVAIGFESYRDSYVNEAKTEGTDRIVRVVDSQRRKPSLWGEMHYIWDGWASRKGFTHSAPGFYVAVRAVGPESTFFDAASLGVMWSFKRTRLGSPLQAGEIAESINIGIGPVWHRTKRLAAGIKDGEPLPPQYQNVEYDKRDEMSWMLMLSVGF